MSNLKVSVTWDTPTAFAGEEVKCTITFRNTASDPSIPRTSVPPPPQARTPSLTPTGGLRGKEWGAGPRAGRPPNLALSDARRKPGHRQTVSLNTPTTSRAPNTPNTPNTEQQQSRGSRTPSHSHKRSISIVSLTSVDNGGKDGQTPVTAVKPAPPPPRRGSHARAASYHGIPTKPANAISSPKLNGALHSGSRSPRAPPLVRAATAQAAKSNQAHEPAKAPLLQGIEDEDSESLLDDASQTTETAASTGNGSASAPLRQRPFPSPLPYRDKPENTPLQRIISPLGTEMTPRSSVDLMSNYSEDTFASEYTQPNMLRANQPRHGRSISQLPPVPSKGSQVEQLMMGYVQLHGSFILDGSLVDLAPFESVKQMGVIGGQGSGGVVGVGTPSKRNSGLFGSFGLSSLGQSIGGMLGGQEMSSMRDMKGIANTKLIPLLSTPQSILFVDMELRPGQSKSFTYKHQLPLDLPPSHKGRAIKIEYQLTIGTQRAQTVGQKNNVRQTDIPFRVFPGLTRNGNLVPHDLMQPHVLLRDQAITRSLDERAERRHSPSITDKSTSAIRSKSAFLAYTNQLLQSSLHANGEALLSPTVAPRESHVFPSSSSSTSSNGNNDGNEQPSIPMRELIELAITRPTFYQDASTSRSGTGSTTQFQIQRAGTPVAIISLVRPAYRLGETITAVVDLRDSAATCHTLNASLETEELVDEAIALRSASSIRRATRRIHVHASEVTTNMSRAVFSFMVPWTGTPEFTTGGAGAGAGVRLEWRVRFEFVTSVSPKAEEEVLEEVGRDERGVLLAAVQEVWTESFEVGVPVRVFGAEGVGVGTCRREGELSI